MKKLFIVLLSVLLLTGCSSSHSSFDESDHNQEITVNDLNILAPSGAPALALVDLFETHSDNITIVEGADVLQASFVNPQPEYDVIIAPTNLGVKLAQSKKTDYRLAAVITWGNLYILAENEEVLKNEDLVFAAFGEQAVPGLVFESVKDELDIENVVYYTAVTEAQAALLAKNASAALIAEPAASATIAKAKQQNINLSIVANIQELWEHKTGSYGYPQASIFVLESENNHEALSDLLTQIDNNILKMNEAIEKGDTDSLVCLIDAVGAETLGVPNAQIVANGYLRMGLNYRTASDCEQELSDFLSLFGITYDSSIAVR